MIGRRQSQSRLVGWVGAEHTPCTRVQADPRSVLGAAEARYDAGNAGVLAVLSQVEGANVEVGVGTTRTRWKSADDRRTLT